MLTRKFLISLVCLANIFSIFITGQSWAKDKKFVVYYSNKEARNQLKNYDVIVLDSKNHPPFEKLVGNKKTILAYLSLGEVEEYRSYFLEVKNQNILLFENKHWPGSYYIDVRDSRWAKRIIEDVIVDIFKEPFDGLFLDTLDNVAHLERINPKKYAGMTKAGANLVKAIRLHYPDIKIMMNRGYELLPYLSGVIDMELAESFYSDYNFDKKTYQLVEKELYESQLKILNEAKKNDPNLEIYTLDYWYPEDKKMLKNIYQKQRQSGFIPYVSTIDLQKIIAEPN